MKYSKMVTHPKERQKPTARTRTLAPIRTESHSLVDLPPFMKIKATIVNIMVNATFTTNHIVPKT